MRTPDVRSAVSAAKSVALALGLQAEEAVVLQDSNRLAVRLLPCDVLARVADLEHREQAKFEVDVARHLAETKSPVAGLDPRVQPRAYPHGGFVVTLWSYYEPLPSGDFAPSEYAGALAQLHRGMREIDLAAPHFTERVSEAQQLVDDATQTPELEDTNRALLGSALRELTSAIGKRGATEQLLHGEPHPGNVLSTKEGLLFIDLETCGRGPVEFDVASMPEAVSEHYPGLDHALLFDCRALALALVAAWRWDRNDRFPNGRQMGIDLLGQLRAAMDRRAGGVL